MPLFDTHCHVDLYPDYADLIGDIERERIYTVAVTNTPSVFRRCLSFTEGKKHLRAALGLHPQLVRDRHREFPLMREMIGETKYVGEVGLDFVTTDEAERQLQRKIFGAILDLCAVARGKVLTIHSRRSAPEVVEMIGSAYPGTIILHWFSGSHKLLDEAATHGCYFSINTEMITSAKGRRLVAAIPRDRTLLESDGPFIAVDNRPARPADVGRVVRKLAELWQVGSDEAERTLYANFRRAVTVD